jgi:hypothetical protein
MQVRRANSRQYFDESGVTTRAALAEARTTEWRLRTLPRVDRIRGSRAHSVQASDDPYAQIRAAALATSGRAVVAGWSAATVWGVPTDFIDGTFDGNRTMGVCINPRGTQHQRQGIQYSYSGLDVTDVVELHGMLVTTGVRTAFDALRLAPWTDRALAWGDACIRFDLTTPTELAGYAADRKRWPGIRRVRALLPMLSALAESPMESVMRFVWVGAGLPEPLVNPEIFDPSGQFIARVDLLDPETGLVGEYNGGWHRNGLQPWSDTVRQRPLERWGFTLANLGGPDFARGAVDAAAELSTKWLSLRASGGHPHPNVRICSR